MGSMFSTVTPAAILTDAGTFAAEIDNVVLLVLGLSVALGLAGWVVKKVRRAAR